MRHTCIRCVGGYDLDDRTYVLAADAPLRAEVARLLIRRLIGPLELYDASLPEWQMPDFIKADAVVKTGLIDGLAEIHDVASLMPASWNRIAGWLQQIDAVRRAA